MAKATIAMMGACDVGVMLEAEEAREAIGPDIALLITFDTREALKQALDDGSVEISVYGGPS